MMPNSRAPGMELRVRGERRRYGITGRPPVAITMWLAVTSCFPSMCTVWASTKEPLPLM